AAAAGLRPGDRVARSAAKAGPLEGDEVEEIDVQSFGESPRLLRLPPAPPAVTEAEVFQDMAHPARAGLGYFRITHFGRSLPVELDSALLRLRSEGARAVVIDLRGNPGGVLASAVQAAERFLARGVIVTARGQPAALRTFSAGGPPAWDLPVVLLV